MEEHTIAYSKSHRKTHIDARGRIDSDANTLSCGDGCTNQSTGNYVFTKVEKVDKEQEERILKLASVDNQKRKKHVKDKTVPEVNIDVEEGMCIATRHLGRNGKLVSDISSTIQVAETPHVTYREYKFTKVDKDMTDIKFVGGVNPKKTWNKDDKRSLSRNYSQGESPSGECILSPCLSANMGGTANGSQLIVEEPEFEIRIRKLTPVETERLQGFPDNYTAKGIDNKGEIVEISNTQRYKLCGNAISSTVPQTLFPAVFGNEPIRVMSLFSGCGGTELLLPDNFEVIGHCEFDKYASSVLRYHYPDIPNFHDVTEFADRDDVPEFDLLVGGFPCQSWSIAGLRKGFDDERGQLIYNVYDIIRKHKPKYLCLENVKGLLSKDKGDAFEAIMEYISGLGYELDFEVVNSKFFGLAQNRERVFIFGKLK